MHKIKWYKKRNFIKPGKKNQVKRTRRREPGEEKAGGEKNNFLFLFYVKQFYILSILLYKNKNCKKKRIKIVKKKGKRNLMKRNLVVSGRSGLTW